MEDAVQGNGLRLGHDLLAPRTRLVKGWRVRQAAPRAASETAQRRPARFLPRNRRQFVGACRARGKKRGPTRLIGVRRVTSTTLVVDANGTPLNVIVTAANRHYSTQLLPLLDGVPPIAGRRGRALTKPRCVQADRGYDCEAYRRVLRQRRITPQIGERFAGHGSHFGMTRWVVERIIAWLHQFRRLRVRYRL
jgi:transposase